MRAKKRALHLAVVAGLVSGIVGVVAPGVAHAAVIPPDTCAMYLQGNVDPSGSTIPADVIPMTAPTTHAYASSGHIQKGQDKVVQDLNNTTLANTKRFSLGINLGKSVNYPTSFPVAAAIQAGATRQVTGTSTTAAGSNVIAGAPSFAPADVGATISNINLIDGTTITVFNSSTSVTVSHPAIATGASLTTTIADLIPADSNTSIKVGWKGVDDPIAVNGGDLPLPTVQVAEAAAANTIKVPVTKGTIAEATGSDNLGAVIGGLQAGGDVTPLGDTQYEVVVPSGATSGTYQLAMSFPPNALGAGVPPTTQTVTTTLNYNDLGGAIQTAMQAAFAANPYLTLIFTGQPTVVQNAAFNHATGVNGDYTIHIGGVAFGSTGQTPPLLTMPDTQTGSLATTVLDTGQLSASKRLGGIDPSITPVSDLGQHIFTVNGNLSSGPAGGAQGGAHVGKNTGNPKYVSDTQITFVQVPFGLISSATPNLHNNAALPLLAAIGGQSTDLLRDWCTLGGLLATFCIAEPAQIPAAYAGFCTGVLDPTNVQPIHVDAYPIAPPNHIRVTWDDMTTQLGFGSVAGNMYQSNVDGDGWVNMCAAPCTTFDVNTAPDGGTGPHSIQIRANVTYPAPISATIPSAGSQFVSTTST